MTTRLEKAKSLVDYGDIDDKAIVESIRKQYKPDSDPREFAQYMGYSDPMEFEGTGDYIGEDKRNIFNKMMDSFSFKRETFISETAQRIAPQMMPELKKKYDIDSKSLASVFKDTSVWQVLPVVRGVYNTFENATVYAVAERYSNGKAQDGDEEFLKSYAKYKNMDSTIPFEIAKGVMVLPSFMAEFVGTFGASKAIGAGVVKSLGGGAIKGFGQTALQAIPSTIAQTAMMPTLISENLSRRLLPDVSIDDAQNLYFTENDDFNTAMVKSLGESWVEVASERTGFLFGKVLAPLNKIGQNALMKLGIANAFARLNGVGLNKATEMAKQFGFHGIIEEFAEERAGDVMRAGLGIEEFKLPTLKQVATELAIFTVPATGVGMANVALSKTGNKADIDPETISISEEENKNIEALKRAGLDNKQIEDLYKNVDDAKRAEVIEQVESKETEETLYAYEEKKLEWIQQAMDRGESMEKAEAKIEGFSKGLEGLSKILGINKIDMAKLMIKDGKEQEATDPLIAEARKYKSAEEFVKAQTKEIRVQYFKKIQKEQEKLFNEFDMSGTPQEKLKKINLRDKATEKLTKKIYSELEEKIKQQTQQLTDIYNKAQELKQEGIDPLIAEARKYKSAEEFVNRIGSRSYYPKESYMINKQARQVSNKTYAENKGINKEEIVTIYRAIPSKAKGISDGDFVTTDKELARFFSREKWVQDEGGSKIVTKKVKAGEIYYPEADSGGYVSNELVYVPDKNKLLNRQQLTEIWNKSQELKPNNTNIFKQEKNKVTKGSYKVIDGTAILSLFEAKDDTTLMHEFAHHFFNIINTYKPEMLEPVLKEAKVKNLDGDNYIKAQEYFARSYEAYLRKGEAPTPELKSLFQKLSEWIREVYKNLSDMEVQLTPTMQKFFDDIYTASETKGKTEAEVKAQQDLELKQKEEEKKKIGLYYEELLKQPDQTLLEKTKASAQDLSKSASDWANKAFVPLSTRLKNINSKLKYVMRDFEFKSLQQHKNRAEQIKPFLEKFSELSEQDGKMLDYALKNSDMTMVYDIVEKNNMVDEFAKVREMLEQIYSEAESVKLDLGYLENYFPRRIENPDKFMTFMRGTEYWTRIEEQLKEVDPMNDMTQAERAEYISTMLRGFGGDKALLAKPSYTKDRQIIELTPEMNKYYKHSTQAIIDYVRAMSEIIEARKLFGKSEKEINKSIGAVVDKMIKDGDIGYENEKKAKEILISRFNQKGVSGLWSLYKDINYMTLLGSPISAITQIEDIALTMYKSGLFNTAQGLIQSITNKGITQTDLGIENISSEFQDKTLMKNAIEKLFKITGFSFMDKLGKESFINGVYLKYKQQAKKPNARFIEMLDNIFGEEATQVIDDLKGDILTDNIKYLMFNELAEIQPITISEMPEYYVKGGNLRLLYALKSFTIKRLDYLRNTVIDEIKADPIKGTANLVRLAMCLIVMGATTDFIKDFILGREVEPKEMLLNNIFKMFGFGKWMLYTARREGLGKAVVSQILPPTKLIDDIYKDIIKQKDLKDLRTISNIPVAGKFWYWWFGGGAK